jgi:hypothetical protein
MSPIPPNHFSTWPLGFVRVVSRARLPHSICVHLGRLARRCSRDRTAEMFTSNPPKIQLPPSGYQHAPPPPTTTPPGAPPPVSTYLIMVLAPLALHISASILLLQGSLCLSLSSGEEERSVFHACRLIRAYRGRRHEREQV